MNVALCISIAIGVVLAIEGFAVRVHLVRVFDRTASDVPVDDRTGLLDERAVDARVTGELKRLERTSGADFSLSVWVTEPGDADAFGRAAADVVAFPDLAFRLDETTYCFARVIDAGAPDPLAERITQLRDTWHVRSGAAQASDVVEPTAHTLIELARARMDLGEHA